MSRPDGVTGCESDEIGQKMCLGDAVGASDLQMLDAPFFQNRIPGFCADTQYLAHLVDVQHVRVIPEHHTVRITGIQIFLTLSLIHIYCEPSGAAVGCEIRQSDNPWYRYSGCASRRTDGTDQHGFPEGVLVPGYHLQQYQHG